MAGFAKFEETAVVSDCDVDSGDAESKFADFFDALREAVLRDFADLDVVDFLVTTSDFAFFALELERVVPESLASA